MLEGEARRVQELAIEIGRRDSVDTVADHREVDRGQMDADLVHAAGLETDAKERVRREKREHLEVGGGISRRVRVERLARRIRAVAADRCLDPAPPRTGLTTDECQVAALELATPDERLQAPVRILASGDHHEARGVPVEPVDDSRPLGIRATGGTVRSERLHKRGDRTTGPGVHDQPCGLVDDDQMLVFVGDPHVERRLSGRKLCRTSGFDLELLATLEPVALWTHAAVETDSTGCKQTFRGRARADL